MPIAVEYERQTIDAANPIVRFAHRKRARYSVQQIDRLPAGATVVDYGCGQGRILSMMAERRADLRLIGWDPFMDARYADGFEILNDPTAIADRSVSLITCLEVCEHLHDEHLEEFADYCAARLIDGGRILVTVPIMVGPALFLKELNRCVIYRQRPEHRISELFTGGLLARVPVRGDDFGPHRGYDYRHTLRYLSNRFALERIDYLPLPIKTWYGNSQVAMHFTSRS